MTSQNATTTNPMMMPAVAMPAPVLAALRTLDLVAGDEPEDDRQHRPDTARDPADEGE